MKSIIALTVKMSTQINDNLQKLIERKIDSTKFFMRYKGEDDSFISSTTAYRAVIVNGKVINAGEEIYGVNDGDIILYRGLLSVERTFPSYYPTHTILLVDEPQLSELSITDSDKQIDILSPEGSPPPKPCIYPELTLPTPRSEVVLPRFEKGAHEMKIHHGQVSMQLTPVAEKPKPDFYKIMRDILADKIEMYLCPWEDFEHMPFNFVKDPEKTPYRKQPGLGEFVYIRKLTEQDGFSGMENLVIIEKGGGDVYEYALYDTTLVHV